MGGVIAFFECVSLEVTRLGGEVHSGRSVTFTGHPVAGHAFLLEEILARIKKLRLG